MESIPVGNKKDIEKQVKTHKKFDKDSLRILPVVFHIVYTEGMPSISEGQVYSQLDALNRDFNSMIVNEDHPTAKKDYSNRAAISKIQFCFPLEDPQNKPTTGFTIFNSSLPTWNEYNLMKSKKDGGVDAWNTDRYINIWVVDLQDSTSGYAQMPGGDKKTDGIVIDYRFFGQSGTSLAPFDEGKTLTHLMGNYLGLYPIWGRHRCGDDYIDDTPIHNAPNTGCPEGNHITTCEGNEVEMTMNFMDNTNDACMYMFTDGQKRRMQAMVSKKGPRGKLGVKETQCNNELREEIAVREEDSLKEVDAESEIGYFIPNPASNTLFFKTKNNVNQSGLNLVAFDLSGKVIYQQNIKSNQKEIMIDVTEWVDGLYVFEVRTEENAQVSKVVIKK